LDENVKWRQIPLQPINMRVKSGGAGRKDASPLATGRRGKAIGAEIGERTALFRTICSVRGRALKPGAGPAYKH